MSQRILIPTDGTAFADRVLKCVRPLLGKRSEVALLHVYPPGVLEDAITAHPAMSRERKRLDRLARLVSRWGARARTAVMVGDPAHAIAAFAASYEPTLIAMATHARAGVARWLEGSVAERVVRLGDGLCLLANKKALDRGRKSRIRRIILPVDGSDRSAAALHDAAKLARAQGAELVLLHVVSPPRAGSTDALMTRAEAKGHLDGLAAGTDGVALRSIIATGRPADAILRAIKREDADLVVMSSRGRTGVARWVFGSVAEKILRNAPCPVLVTRAGRQARPKAAVARERAQSR